MKAHRHAAISLTISGILFLAFRSWGLAAANLIAGVFIDIDHIFDYMREHGRNLDVKDFFRVNDNAQYNRIFLFWHAWEWVAMLGAAAWLTDWNPWITGAFIGMGHHIFLDCAHNISGFKSYSLIWRWKKAFVFDTIFHGLKDRKYEYLKNFHAKPGPD